MNFMLFEGRTSLQQLHHDSDFQILLPFFPFIGFSFSFIMELPFVFCELCAPPTSNQKNRGGTAKPGKFFTILCFVFSLVIHSLLWINANFLFRMAVMLMPLPMFWALYDQQYSVWVVQSLQMDCRLWGDVLLLPDQMQIINPGLARNN